MIHATPCLLPSPSPSSRLPIRVLLRPTDKLPALQSASTLCGSSAPPRNPVPAKSIFIKHVFSQPAHVFVNLVPAPACLPQAQARARPSSSSLHLSSSEMSPKPAPVIVKPALADRRQVKIHHPSMALKKEEEEAEIKTGTSCALQHLRMAELPSPASFTRTTVNNPHAGVLRTAPLPPFLPCAVHNERAARTTPAHGYIIHLGGN
ncbi:hypothetical protein B0H13DRAFT_2374648 [Mycena leptocephala]|nr:hypothetical protein B0H13DRAFT_2374648 [Mycena leptocephala]